jgi:hypothetical protein
MAMVVSCPDDLVTATHPVRMVMAVVEKLDLSRFHEPIKARHGVAGRDATAPPNCWWRCGSTPAFAALARRANWRAAARRALRFAGYAVG